ncbi:hypothetical protein DNTS_001611 [Danionella cerebrum]|uniref:Chromodomain-helicase-DNA-binding protein 1-like n=1 Tax=Danionella cerebrum TaxID=2873325 RepID=A0A553MN83_9TELE|nr:hypothetical protein DNTS_001611 [Danionella translucida]
MSKFLRAVKNIPEKNKSELSENDLRKWGLGGIHLRSYQLDGVRWLSQCMKNQQGCILGDEMGLGKTCQTISLLAYARGYLKMNGPFLVICPLSVLENWKQELERFCPSLFVVRYTGDKERRAELQKELKKEGQFHVLLTTYEFSVGFRVLLTGTPIQNNLQEVYSLLTFIEPSLFIPEAVEDFTEIYADIQTEPALADELHQVLQPFLLRRVKAEVAADLPKKTELVVFHGLSALQKRYYKAILMRDLDAFKTHQNTKTQLLNILMQLRKCVDHPYLFDGVEPEPFEMGEHLVEASGKLSLLATMLAYLQEGGHHVLLFSQMTRMLDILQDFLEYRGYSYERLDGSVRGEERNLAIKNFNSKDVFIFLLSTKAGGVGMNLTAADTVIFVDSDFNPQNDLQAAARAHRIGQTRPVKVIRLLGRDTVEEIIYSRAVSKLRLTDTVIEEGRFSLLDQAQSAASGLQLSEILKFGIDKLLSSEESSIQDVDLEFILGQSRNGQWLTDEEQAKLSDGKEEDEDTEGQSHMYYFEGKDYSKDPSAEDEKTFELLIEKQISELEDAGKEGRALRNKAGVSLSGPLLNPLRKKRPLTDTELEQRRQKRLEAAAKRVKLQQERKKQQEELNYKKKMAWWDSCGYRSVCLPGVDSEGEDDVGDDESWGSTDSDHTAIHYVLGDVTHPQADREDAIIVHCVDDSGHWGRGGLFTALELRSDTPRKVYELAGDMKDLELGNVLLFPIDDKQSRLSGRDYLALIVAQERDRANKLSGIRLTALDEGLKKICRAAKQKKASVHLPRIGHSTKSFNWYGTERLIRKHLATKGIPTSIYYYRRASSTLTTSPTNSNPVPSPNTLNDSQHTECSSASDEGQGAPGLADFMRGVHVYFYNIGATQKKQLSRYLITYPSDTRKAYMHHNEPEVESPVHAQELRDLFEQYPQAVLVTKTWLDSCFANQRKVNFEGDWGFKICCLRRHIKLTILRYKNAVLSAGRNQRSINYLEKSGKKWYISPFSLITTESLNLPEENDETMDKIIPDDAICDSNDPSFANFLSESSQVDYSEICRDRKLNYIPTKSSNTPYQQPLGLPSSYNPQTPFPSQNPQTPFPSQTETCLSTLESQSSLGSTSANYPSGNLPSCLVSGSYSNFSDSSFTTDLQRMSEGSLDQPRSLHSIPTAFAPRSYCMHSFGLHYCSQFPGDVCQMQQGSHYKPHFQMPFWPSHPEGNRQLNSEFTNSHNSLQPQAKLTQSTASLSLEQLRPAMIYGLETVAVRKGQEAELEVAEMRMLRFSLGVKRMDKIRNEHIRGTAQKDVGDGDARQEVKRKAKDEIYGCTERGHEVLDALYCQPLD